MGREKEGVRGGKREEGRGESDEQGEGERVRDSMEKERGREERELFPLLFFALILTYLLTYAVISIILRSD